MKIIFAILSIAIASVFMWSCACEPQKSEDAKASLKNTVWVPVFLKNSEGAKMPSKENDGEIVYMSFDKTADRINGMSGNNLFGGEVKISGNGGFKTDKVYSTRRMGPFDQYETKFLSALNNADRIELKANSLKLSDKNGTLLEFKRSDALKNNK